MDFWELWVIQFAFSSALLQTLPQNSFVGCLKNFQLDLKPLDTASASFGVSPCLEKGIYFPQEGGHVILGKEQFGRLYIFIALILKNSYPFFGITMFKLLLVYFCFESQLRAFGARI